MKRPASRPPNPPRVQANPAPALTDPIPAPQQSDTATAARVPTERTEPMTSNAPAPQPAATPSWDALNSVEAFSIVSVPVMLADADMVIRFVNEAAYQMFEAIESDIRSGTADVYNHEMPGGQYTNLREQARATGLEPSAPKSTCLAMNAVLTSAPESNLVHLML